MINSGELWYNIIAKLEPNIENITGNNLNNIGKLNSASIKATLFGWTNKELAKKSEPTPTNKSEKIYPNKILNNANITKGIITAQFASWEFKYIVLDPLGTVKKTRLINLKE